MFRALKYSIVVAALSVSFSAHAAFEGCKQFFANGVPPKVSASTPRLQRELCFTGFAILHSGQSKTPVYVAEKLNRAHLLDAMGEVRTEKFYEEARLPSAERAKRADYRRSGYDQGHMGAAANSANPETMAQSFSLANVVPQDPDNNRKLWRGIEQSVRKYALRASGDVFVITGPVYSLPAGNTIGQSQVWVPDHLFKLVYDQTSGRAWAYWVANTGERQIPRPISYAQLVKLTGTEFLPGVRTQD